MKQIDIIAREHGFLSYEDLVRQTTASKEPVGEIFGVDIIGEPLMPEGFFGLRTESGVMACGPNGNSLWVPFGLPVFKTNQEV